MKDKTNICESVLLTIGAFFLNCYIFLGHFNFPFSTTYFIYIAVLCLLLSIIFKGKISIDKGVFYYILIIIITIIGLLYTQCMDQAVKQLQYFLIYGLIYFIVKQKKDDLSNKFVKIYFFFSIAVLLSVYIQFIFPSAFNHFLQKYVNSGMYLTIMHSFTVDRSYVGISPSVTVTSFALGVLMFSSGISFLGNFFETSLKKESSKYNIIIFALAVFGIIITNKRGIFISSVVAFLIALVLDKDISVKKTTKNKLLITIFSTIFIVLIGVLLLSNNMNVIHFINRFKGNNLLTGREVFYVTAINSLNNHGIFSWLFGMGTGSAYVINSAALHNVYLQVIYDHGIFGFLIFSLFFSYNLKNSIKKGNSDCFIQLSVQLSFLIYCLSGNPLYSYYIMIPYMMFCVYKNNRKEDNDENRNINIS